MSPEKRQRPAATGRSVEQQQAKSEHRIVRAWRLVGAATRRPGFTHGDVAVLWSILDRIGEDGTAWPGYGRIATDTGLDRSTVSRSIRKLVDEGFILRESGGPGKSNRYRAGRGTDAPRRTDAPRGAHAPTVGAPTPLGVGAYTHPEPASLNLLQEPTKSGHAKDGATVDIPAWLPADAWQAWIDHRKAVGRKFTPHAQQLAIRRLETLRGEGHDPRKLIELAIESGWSSFNPRPQTQTGNGKAGRIERDTRNEAEIEAANLEQLARFGMEAMQ